MAYPTKVLESTIADPKIASIELSFPQRPILSSGEYELSTFRHDRKHAEQTSHQIRNNIESVHERNSDGFPMPNVEREIIGIKPNKTTRPCQFEGKMEHANSDILWELCADNDFVNTVRSLKGRRWSSLDPRMVFKLCRAYMALGEQDCLLDMGMVIEQSIAEFSNLGFIDAAIYLRCLYAAALRNSGQMSKSDAILDSEQNQENTNHLFNGTRCLNHDEFEGAIHSLESAVGANLGLDPILMNWIGVAYFNCSMLEDALFWFNKAITACPSHTVALTNLALCESRQHQGSTNGSACREHLQKVVDILAPIEDVVPQAFAEALLRQTLALTEI